MFERMNVMPTTAERTAPTLPQAHTTCCPPTEPGDSATAGDTATPRYAAIFKALGDPTRLRLLHIIASNPAGEECICDLTEPVALSQPTVSHHMRLLTQAGLVRREQRGKWAYFILEKPVYSELSRYLRELTR